MEALNEQQHGSSASQRLLAVSEPAAAPQLPPRRIPPVPPPRPPTLSGWQSAQGLRSRTASSARDGGSDDSALHGPTKTPPELPSRPSAAVTGSRSQQHDRASSTLPGGQAPAVDDTARFPGGARPALSVGTAGSHASIPNIYETPPTAASRKLPDGSASSSPGPSRSPSPQRHRPRLTSLQTSTSSLGDEYLSGSNEAARPTLQLFGLASPVRQDIQAALEELRNLELVNACLQRPSCALTGQPLTSWRLHTSLFH